MTQTVRFLSRYMDVDEKTADVVCRLATAVMLPSSRNVGAGGDVQSAIALAAIVLHEVEPASMETLRGANWTHVHWSDGIGGEAHVFVVWRILIEGENVRVLV